MLNVDKIYIAHYLPLIDRKDRLLNSLQFDVQWMEDEPDEKYWSEDKDEWDKKAIPCSEYRALTKSEISLAHKHIEIYKDIVKNNFELSLILEDDVVFVDNFNTLFNLFLDKTPDDWDIIFIGSGCDLSIHADRIVPNQIAYKVDHPASKCTDSYCIKLNAAKKILSTTIPFSLPYDFELNYQMKLHNLSVYWWEPHLVVQGSQSGLYESAIQE